MTEHEPTQPEPEVAGERPPAADYPRVWIGSLSDYTGGVLHGEWMDAAVSEEELQAQIAAMLTRSEEQPAEEWMIFDSDNFGSYRVGEYDDLASLTAIARGIVEHGPAFAVYAELQTGDLEHFSDVFLGASESREAWAQTIVEDFGVEEAVDRLDLPDWLKGHIQIDLNGIAHDLVISGDVAIEDNPDGGVWVFDGRV